MSNQTAPRPIPAPHWSATPIARLLGPMQEFIHQSASGGIVLMVMTIIALLVANSPLADSYFAILETKVGFNAGFFQLEKSVIHIINDGLMAIFFFLVGLEIKREVLVGELSNLRAALLPIIAAIGGAAVPALIYFAINAGGYAAKGWGIPMATDIAFALGCLALLGSRVPFALKIFLTAVAIVDDLMAVLVIAIFYSSGIDLAALGTGFALLAVLIAVNVFGFRNPLIYVLIGFFVWLAFLQSGVHATIAGVLIAMTIPARNRIDAPTFAQRAHQLLHHFEQRAEAEGQPARMVTDEEQQTAVIELEELCENVQAPLQKMEHKLHAWSAFFILPIFALANAGVPISAGSLSGEGLPVLLGVVLGLVLGKPIGLVGATWLAVRAGITSLPAGITWAHILGVGLLAGIGFTMSLFIATLGLTDPAVLASAKLAILIASVLAGSIGMFFLSRVLPKTAPAA